MAEEVQSETEERGREEMEMGTKVGHGRGCVKVAPYYHRDGA